MYQLCFFSPATYEQIEKLSKYTILHRFEVSLCQTIETLSDHLQNHVCHVLVIDAAFGEEILKQVAIDLKRYPSLKIVVASKKGEGIPLEYGTNAFRYLFKDNLEYITDIFNSILKELDQDYFYLPIQVNQRVIILKQEDIYYIDASHNYLYIYCKEDVYKVRMTLKEVTKYLNENFISIVKGMIINRKWVKEIDKKAHQIIMIDGKIISMSRSYATQFKSQSKN